MVRNKFKAIDYTKVVEEAEEKGFYQEIAKAIVIYLKNNGSVTFEQIVKRVGGSDRRTLRLLDQMIQSKILRYNKPYFYLYKHKNKNSVKAFDMNCNLRGSKPVDIKTKERKELADFMRKVVDERPLPTFVFDQRPVTAETTVRRVAYALSRNDIQNKKVAIIGDDDLTSIALAKSGFVREIVVFDIDIRILDYIDEVSKINKLKIKTVKLDLLKRVPREYVNYFDTFMTDPTPTLKPLSLFVNSGLTMLSGEKGRVGYVSLYPTHMETSIDFQKALSRMNLLITDIIPFFNEYDFIPFTYSRSDLKLLKKYASGEQKISFCESLMRLETISSSRTFDIKLTPKDMLGRATRRVLKDTSKDPAIQKGDSSEDIEKTVLDFKAYIVKKK